MILVGEDKHDFVVVVVVVVVFYAGAVYNINGTERVCVRWLPARNSFYFDAAIRFIFFDG